MSTAMKENPDTFGEKEILTSKIFLKQLANEYSDMDLLSRGIIDPAKATEARQIAKEFRKAVRECDDAASKSDLNKIVDLYPTTASLLDKFLSFLQDVPDEL